jgi:glycogen synthase
MKVCLIAPARCEVGEPGYSSRRLGALLAAEHDVTVIHSGTPEELPEPLTSPRFREVFASLPQDLSPLKFACSDHRCSAAVMATIRRLYEGGGPDYVEACDFRAHGLVALQARRSGDPLLAETTIAVRMGPTAELLGLHDGLLRLPGNQRRAELEREQLRLADRLIWPGGDCLDLYRRYYHDLELPPGARIGHPYELLTSRPDILSAPAEGPLRLLCIGELRRSKGVLDLVEACWLLPPESWRLTLAGEDTETAPMGQSVRATIEAMGGDDPRIEFRERLTEPALGETLAEADLVVIPSRLEVSATAAMVAMTAGLPVLASPVGALTEVVEPGVSGWLADDIGPPALAAALAAIERDRGELRRLRESGSPARRAQELADPGPLLAGYRELLRDSGRATRPPRTQEPLVAGIIPYHRASGYVAEAVASLLAQTYPRVEVLIVNDGSFAPGDEVLEELARDPRVQVVTQVQAGESAARTLGARLTKADYVVMLDADNVLEPRFVERALQTLQANPDLVYATCWLRMIGPDGRDTSIHPGYAPLGNSVLSDDGENWDGDTLAMLPRRVFTDLGFEYHPEGSMHSDWQLYRWMRSRGAYGAVIPERLARYRVVQTSLLRSYSQGLQERSWGESLDWPLLSGTRWTAEGAR